MSSTLNRLLYAAAVIANAGLTVFAIQLGAGKVPVPEAWQWAMPVAVAMVTTLCALLPRIGAEPIAMQVDALKRRGVPRRNMVVVSEDEAIRGIGHAEDTGTRDDPTTRPPRGGIS